MDIQTTFDSAKIFTRRAFMLAGLQGLFLGVLGGRLAWLQVSQGQRYKTLADKNRINIKMLAPSRGVVMDRFGIPMAVNNQNFGVVMVPEQMENRERVLRHLQTLIALTEDQIQNALKKASKAAKFLPVEIKDNLRWEEVAKIEVNLPDLPGLAIHVGEIRDYPMGESTAHLVGYVGAVTKKDIDKDPVLSLPGFKIGKTAIEKKFDEDLRGKAGASEVEVNVIGREVRELHRKPGAAGKNIVLSIDSRLQDFTQNRLNQERSASAVVMNAHTGELYTLASSPTFDANLFPRGLSAEKWEELLNNPGHTLTNKAIAGQYPPGSTFKMVTALAALEAGIITRNNHFYCPGFYEFGGNRFHCWKSRGHGMMNLVTALMQSCDTYFYEIARDIGIDRIAQAARKLGLGSQYGFELSEERPGLIPDRDWKLGYMGDVWRPGETIVASIGQGYMLTTPMQLAVMTSRLVNGGHAVEPWIAAYLGQENLRAAKWPKMNVKDSHLELIKQGMDSVVNSPKGTARASRIETPGMEMGGKTGTAQVKRITMAQRMAGVKNKDLPWKHRHHALFVGYAPVENPRYVASVVVEHGVGGSTAAAPLARDLLQEVQSRKLADLPIYEDNSRAQSAKATQKGRP